MCICSRHFLLTEKDFTAHGQLLTDRAGGLPRTPGGQTGVCGSLHPPLSATIILTLEKTNKLVQIYRHKLEGKVETHKITTCSLNGS